MTYQETLDYLFSKLPMYQRIGAGAYKSDLNNTLELCSLMDNPERKFRSIHIAGTNGKGSTSHMLAAVLQEAGYKTGLYTSPHLKDFRERIRVNGLVITEEEVIDFTEKYKDEFSRIKPSFFEMTVAMCFEYFVKEKVDIAVIETGLGGRLDSTNVIIPELAVITNISNDHNELLGATIELIAYEKAGIIKKQVPVVVGETDPLTEKVFKEKAKFEDAPIVFADQHYTITKLNHNADFLEVSILRNGEHSALNLSCDLSGDYQLKNLVTVIAAIDELKNQGFIISNQDVINAIGKVKEMTGLLGRWQLIGRDPLQIADTAHNEGGLKYVTEQIARQTYDNLHFVIGVVKEKNLDPIFPLLPADASYYFCKPDIPRGLDAKELMFKASKAGLIGEAYETVGEALRAARKAAKQNDMIFIGGSTFVVAEAI